MLFGNDQDSRPQRIIMNMKVSNWRCPCRRHSSVVQQWSVAVPGCGLTKSWSSSTLCRDPEDFTPLNSLMQLVSHATSSFGVLREKLARACGPTVMASKNSLSSGASCKWTDLTSQKLPSDVHHLLRAHVSAVARVFGLPSHPCSSGEHQPVSP